MEEKSCSCSNLSGARLLYCTSLNPGISLWNGVLVSFKKEEFPPLFVWGAGSPPACPCPVQVPPSLSAQGQRLNLVPVPATERC